MNARMPGADQTLPQVNGIALCAADEEIDEIELRQRTCTELLRQDAISQGLLAADDPAPERGAISEAAAAAIERLLDSTLEVSEPDDEACRRHHAAHPERYAVGERVQARHVLFAVLPGIDLNALRRRAEGCLLELRNLTPAERAEGDRFAAVAASTSNCPSAQDGGSLGWLQRDDCAPEFSRELFGHTEVGVLPRLVASRHGLHVVEVLARERGHEPAYEQVRDAVAATLRRHLMAQALSQRLQRLADDAQLVAVAHPVGDDLQGEAVLMK